MEKRKRWGARPAARFMGQGDKAARARTCTAVSFPLQRIFGFGRYPSPPGCGGNRRGRKWVSHAHDHHYWPPREVQEEVTALGVALGAWRERSRVGGAAGVCGSSRTGGAGGGAMEGGAVATSALGAAVALATAGTAAAEASPGATAAECPAAAASPGVGSAAEAEGTGG